MREIFTQSQVFATMPIREWIFASVLFIVLVIGFRLIQGVFIARLERIAERSQRQWDNILIAVLRSVRPVQWYVIAFLIAVQTLDITHNLHVIGVITFILVITSIATQVVGVVATHLMQAMARDGAKSDDNARAAVSLMSSIFKVAIWVGSALLIMSNIGVNVTSLIAGLGIGGIAVALALQSILKDLFSSFSLFFDKPFTIGDFIEAGDKSGTVQKIGIKTTRLKALSGEEITIPNQDLTNAHLRNFKRMKERRVAQKIGVVYETSEEKLAQVTGLIEGVINGVDHVRFSRAHLRDFDDWALTFEIVYFVKSRDYRQYMDAREAINFGIIRIFAENGITMAYPTQMVYYKSVR